MHRVSFGSNKSLGVDGQIQTSDFKWHERTYLFRALSQISALSGQMLSKSEGVKEQRLHLTTSLLYVCSFYGSVNGNPIAGKAFNPNSVTLVDSGIHCIHCCLFELFVLGLNHGGWGVCASVPWGKYTFGITVKAKPYWRLQRREYYNSCCKILRTRRNMQKSAYSVSALFIQHLYITVCGLAVVLRNRF